MSLFDFLRIDPNASMPLVAQLVQQITWLIVSGELKEGDRLPTIREMAEALGIHMHTVRAAYHQLEDSGLVSTRPRVGTHVLGYQPLQLTETRPDLPTYTFGVILPDINPIYAPFARGIEAAARESNWLPLYCYTQDDPLLAKQYLSKLIARQVDGFIAASTGMEDVMGDMMQSEQFPPVVFADAPNAPGYNVQLDSTKAAYLAVEHLIQHGHQQIGAITCTREWPNVDQCMRGFEQAMSDAGLTPDPDLIVEVDDFTSESGSEGMMRLAERLPRPGAVFVIADMMALGAIRAIYSLGLSIPHDIALTSYNNIEEAGLIMPGLTTATLPSYEMGVEAANMLLKLLTGKEVSQKKLVLGTELVIRQSCGCP